MLAVAFIPSFAPLTYLAARVSFTRPFRQSIVEPSSYAWSRLFSAQSQYCQGRNYAWTPEENALVRTMHQEGASYKEVSERLNGSRIEAACRNQVSLLKRPKDESATPKTAKRRAGLWSASEEQVVISMREKGASLADIAHQLPGRDVIGVSEYWCRSLQPRERRAIVSHQGSFTRSEVEYVSKALSESKLPIHVIAPKIGRSEVSTRQFRRREHSSGGIEMVANQQAPERYWSKADNRLLWELHKANATPQEMAERFPTRPAEIIQAHLRGLIASRQNLRPGTLGRSTESTIKLRQELINLRARNVKWKDICTHYPTEAYSKLAKQFLTAKAKGMVPTAKVED